MNSKTSPSGQNKQHLDALIEQNKTLFIKLEIKDSRVISDVNQKNTSVVHFNMMGMVIFITGLTFSMSILLMDEWFQLYSKWFQFNPNWILPIVLIPLGLVILKRPKILDFWNPKEELLKKKIDHYQQNMLDMRSFISDYYTKQPESVTETYDDLRLFQNTLYIASHFLTSPMFVKTFAELPQASKNPKNNEPQDNTQEAWTAIKNSLKKYGIYLSKNNFKNPYSELHDLEKQILEAMKKMGVNYQDKSSK